MFLFAWVSLLILVVTLGGDTIVDPVLLRRKTGLTEIKLLD